MKISCRADFSKISRTLVIDADFDGEAFVWAMDSDKEQLLALEKFNDWDRAIEYYASQYVSFAYNEGVEMLGHMFKSLANVKVYVMTAKIECCIEFEPGKKTIAMQGVIGGSWSVTAIDKRLSVNHKEDFDCLYDALEEFKALAGKFGSTRGHGRQGSR